MTAIVILITGTAVAFRTMLYGIWTIKQKNITGGVFVLILSLACVFIAARYYIIS